MLARDLDRRLGEAIDLLDVDEAAEVLEHLAVKTVLTTAVSMLSQVKGYVAELAKREAIATAAECRCKTGIEVPIYRSSCPDHGHLVGEHVTTDMVDRPIEWDRGGCS